MPPLFLDMDGVLVDFLGGALKWFNIKGKSIEKHWPKGKWGDEETIQRIYNKSMDDFWRGLDDHFWNHLDWMPDGRQILDLLSCYKPIILTAPAWAGASGKQAWLLRETPELIKSGRYIMTPAKEYLCSYGRVLVDDYDENINKWEKWGGIGILIPRIWNSKYKERHDVLGYLEQKIRDVIDVPF